MPIRVEYGPELDTVLQVAAEAGAGQAQQRTQQLNAQRQAQLDSIFAAAMQQDRAAEVQAETDQRRSVLQMEEARQQLDMQLESKGRELSMAQQHQRARIEQNMARAKQMFDSGQLNEQQFEATRTQHVAQLLGLGELPMGGEKMTQQQRFEQGLVQGPKGEMRYYNERKGTWEELGQPAMPGAGPPPIESDDDAMKLIKDEMRGNPDMTLEEAAQRVEKKRALAHMLRARSQMAPEEVAAADAQAALPELLQRRDELARFQYQLNPEDADRAQRVQGELAKVEEEIAAAQQAAGVGEAPAAPDASTQPLEVNLGGQRVRPTEQAPPPAVRGQAKDPDRARWMLLHVSGREAPMTEEEFQAAHPDASRKDFGEYRTEYLRWGKHGPSASLPRVEFNEFKMAERQLEEKVGELARKHGARWRQTREGKALRQEHAKLIEKLSKEHPQFGAALELAARMRGRR